MTSGAVAHHVQELLLPGGIVFTRLYENKKAGAQAQRLGVTQRNLPANNAALLEFFDAVPDGRFAGACALGQFIQ